MGLDQYGWALRTRPATDVDFDLPEISDDTLANPKVNYGFTPDPVFGSLYDLKPDAGIRALAYWRKHPDLHGFLRPFYAAKNGSRWTFGEFCGPLVLEPVELDALEMAVMKKTLPKTQGFFFGASGPGDDERTLEFVKRARAAIQEGWTVVYDSSW